MNSNFMLKAFRVLSFACIATTFAVAAFAQGDGVGDQRMAVGSHIKTAKVIGRKSGQATFCIEFGEAANASYRLNISSLSTGQPPEASVATRKSPIDSKKQKAWSTANFRTINGGGAAASTVDADAINACGESLQAPETATVGRRTVTRSGIPNERLAVVIVEGLPACAAGSICDYVWTVEEVSPDGTSIKLLTSVQNPYMFAVSPEGAIKPATSERRRVEVLKSN